VNGDSDEWEEDSDVAYDENGNGPYAITNPALERVTITVPRTRRNLTLKKNFTWIVQDWIGVYEGAVNSVAITILGKNYPARTLRIRKISFTRQRYGMCNFYYPTTFHLDIDFNTFDFIVPNRSYNRNKALGASNPPKSADELVPITLKDDTRVREPHYIDKNANEIQADANGIVTPTYRRWRKFVELPFAVFNFPSA
jgi:hypothetical protein